MLADTAVAVHPDDERYAALVGKRATLPIVGRSLPIIADEHVDPEFGTGALKITPGHDPNDFEIGRRHELEEIVVIGEDGLMSDAAGERFAGMSTNDAQRAIVEELREQGLLRAEEEYTHSVPFSHRSGRADRAADLAAVVLRDGGFGSAGDRGGRERPGADHPRPAQARLSRLDAQHPPLVRLAPALVGSPAAGLVRARGRGDRRRVGGARARRRERARTRSRFPDPGGATSWTPGSPRRSGPSRRSGGPTPIRPICGPFIRRTSFRPRGTSSSCGSRGW